MCRMSPATRADRLKPMPQCDSTRCSAATRDGIPFVYFGVEDHVDYHRPTDDFENVDPAEYVASVHTILTVMRALDEALSDGLLKR